MTTTDVIQIRKRSPTFSFYSIKECVDLISKLKKQIEYTEVAAEFAIRKLNMSPKSSSAKRAVASLLNYGLLTSKGEGEGKTVRLSETSRRILLGVGSDQIDAYRKAALNDGMMMEIWNLWKWDLPNDQETIISKLKLNWQFRDDAAERFAHVIQENYEAANLKDFSGTPTLIDENKNQDKESQNYSQHPSLNPNRSKQSDEIQSSMRKANLLLGNNREILIYVPDDLTEEEFNRIPSWLDIQKYGLLGDNNAKE